MHKEVPRQRKMDIACADVEDGRRYASDNYVVGSAQADKENAAVPSFGDKKTGKLRDGNLCDRRKEINRRVFGKQVQFK